MTDLETKLSQVDPESRKFILWTLEQVQSDDLLTQAVQQFTDEAREWLLTNKDDLVTLLFEKMIKGAKEHGPPLHDTNRLDRERQGEYLDLIGWGMIARFNKEMK